jgi:VIT1/CCC1 family predicted Fe2+/Mn2+ transporter
MPLNFSLREFVGRHLDVPSRLEEILFGLVMVLTVTLTAGLAVDKGPAGVRQLLLAAIGCNIAWGLIDALMYVMSAVTARSRNVMLADTIRRSADRELALAIATDEVDARMGPLISARARELLAAEVIEATSRIGPKPSVLTGEDVRGGIACFWLVFASCLPAVIPFLIFSDPTTALRVSNALLLAMLFIAGRIWSAYTGTNRMLGGAIAVALGLVMVFVAILLGG